MESSFFACKQVIPSDYLPWLCIFYWLSLGDEGWNLFSTVLNFSAFMDSDLKEIQTPQSLLQGFWNTADKT